MTANSDHSFLSYKKIISKGFDYFKDNVAGYLHFIYPNIKRCKITLFLRVLLEKMAPFFRTAQIYFNTK
jgi:hypothetical protein